MPPIITSILTLPGLTPANQGSGTIQVGIVINNSRIAWGTCPCIPGDHPLDMQLRVEEGIATIEKIVIPHLLSQKLTNFRQVISGIEALRETVTVTKSRPQPERKTQGVSRRAIITGFLSSAEPGEAAEQEEKITIERPLHPAIRFGLSQAILSAMSLNRGVTEAEIIAEEFELSIPTMPVALQIPVNRGQSLLLYDQVSALAYTIDVKTSPEDSLGTNGKRIQRFIRQLRDSLKVADQRCPIMIHLDVKGSLGLLYNNDMGKILGALYGLEQAAAPCSLCIEDPLVMDVLADQIEALKQLKDYIRMRQMSVQIAAGAMINTLDNVQTIARAHAVHKVRLEMVRVGTIQELVLSVKDCRANGIEILMEGFQSSLTAQVALAIQPDLLTYPLNIPGDRDISQFHDEMARTLAWLAKKKE